MSRLYARLMPGSARKEHVDGKGDGLHPSVIEGSGTVKAVLPDVPGHRRIVVERDRGGRVLVSHNRAGGGFDGVSAGDRVEFCGEHVPGRRGGILHWTHAPVGYLRLTKTSAAGLDNPLVNADDLRLKRTIGAVVRDRRNRMLMLGHRKFDMLTIPVGKVEPGESPRSAVRRELLEEVGVRARRLRLVKRFNAGVDLLPGVRQVKEFNVYEVPEWDGVPRNMEPEKHTFMRFMSDRQIRNMSRRTGKEIGIATQAAMGDWR